MRFKRGRGSLEYWTPEAVSGRFWTKVEKIPFHSCWEWNGGRYTSGYGAFTLHQSTGRPGERACGNEYAHRVSWLLQRGPIKDGLHVLHKCDNRTCVNPDHLFLGTNTDNVRDMRAKGRTRMFGTLMPKGKGLKLTADQVREIRTARADGASLSVLAIRYGVAKAAISAISNRKTWDWLDKQEVA